jgi:hypothetical protein
MTMVLPQRDLRRSGSFLITSGLYEGKFKSKVQKDCLELTRFSAKMG